LLRMRGERAKIPFDWLFLFGFEVAEFAADRDQAVVVTMVAAEVDVTTVKIGALDEGQSLRSDCSPDALQWG
jgi:hypothetical protein